MVAVLFLGWYFLYVAASVFARGVMAYRLPGDVNVAVVLGLAQFAAAFLIAWRHGRYRREVLDPLAAQIVADADRRVRSAARRHATGPSAPSGPPARMRPRDLAPDSPAPHEGADATAANGAGTGRAPVPGTGGPPGDGGGPGGPGGPPAPRATAGRPARPGTEAPR